MHNESVRSNIPNIPIRISYTHPSLRKPSAPHVLSVPHLHSEAEFLYIEEGLFSCTINGEEIVAKPGELIYISGHTPHQTKTIKENTYTSMLQFSPIKFIDTNENISKYLYRFINIEEIPYKLFTKDDEVTSLLISHIKSICDESYHRKNGHEHFIKSGVYAILGLLYRESILLNPENYFNSKSLDRLLPALNYIDEHHNEQVSLDYLSNMLNINRHYFCRLFKNATNSTFTEYLNFVKVCKSEKLLMSSDMTMSEIALELGFASLPYFSRTFRRFKGVSPTEYRKIQYSKH